MPLFLELDRSTGKFSRIISSDEPPEQTAHVSFQMIPRGLKIDPSMSIDEVMGRIEASMTKEDVAKASSSMEDQDLPPRFVEL